MQIDLRYLTLTIVLFTIELFIAIGVRDLFIRPFVGDVLVVILIYCFVGREIPLIFANAFIVPNAQIDCPSR